MDNPKQFTPKQVGERVKERRMELKLSMPELGKRIGVNKSTIQRYETDGVDPKRTMIINGLAEALLTTPEWLIGLSDAKEYDSYTLCKKSIDEHIKHYLDEVTSAVKGSPPSAPQRAQALLHNERECSLSCRNNSPLSLPGP